MAATKAVHRSAGLGGSNGTFLIDQLQIVAPRKDMPVPNHLLETKIYSKVAQNSVVQARPSVVHFGGFELGKTMIQKLYIANVSGDVQRYHIIPPQSKYFNIKYTKNDRLVPGLTLDCVIEFYPDEYRYYYDSIRIHCKGDDNLIIPIHAYPIMSRTEFPEQLAFPPVPVGETRSKKLPLVSHCPVDFEYNVNIPQHHAAFSISPMEGTIPAMGETYITVVFSPSDFTTCQCTIQVNVSQFNAKPLMCIITGTSGPGLLKELSESSQKESEDQGSVLDPSCLSPVDRSRRKKKVRRHRTTSGSGQQEKNTEIEKNGLKFPVNLNSPFAVASVLNQEPGKLRAKDIREAAQGLRSESSTRQMKEALFDQAIRQNVYEERQNQLRWQVRLGEEQISQRDRLMVLEQREESWELYKKKRGDTKLDEESLRSCTECVRHRTQRDYQQVVREDAAQFDMYKNDPWEVKHDILSKFAQLARTVIIRKRAEDKLHMLGDMMKDMGQRKHSMFHSSANLIQEKEEADPEAEVTLSLSRDVVTSVTFPIYKSSESPDDMAPDAPDAVTVPPTTVTVKHKVPYYNLKVPDEYKLSGYESVRVDQASRGYVAPGLARQLRTGAEDEYVNLPMPTTQKSEQLAPESTADEFVPVVEPDPASLPLNPPESLLQPPAYPDLHIFNPSPGLQVYTSNLPYSETDSDFHLCPQPRPRPGQTSFLDREDVIKGVMQWKKLPSQGLTSLSNTPTLTNVWVPRWAESFCGRDLLLPETPPPLLDSLPDDDVVDEDGGSVGEDEVVLTPEMVTAQFPQISAATSPNGEKPNHKEAEEFPLGSKLPPTNIPTSHIGPVSRDLREQDLDYFLNNKYNRLGQKIHQKVHHINQIKTNKDLVLE